MERIEGRDRKNKEVWEDKSTEARKEKQKSKKK